jgi:hypothetical protein
MTTIVEKQKQHKEDMLKIFKEETPLYDDLINIIANYSKPIRKFMESDTKLRYIYDDENNHSYFLKKICDKSVVFSETYNNQFGNKLYETCGSRKKIYTDENGNEYINIPLKIPNKKGVLIRKTKRYYPETPYALIGLLHDIYIGLRRILSVKLVMNNNIITLINYIYYYNLEHLTPYELYECLENDKNIKYRTELIGEVIKEMRTY